MELTKEEFKLFQKYISDNSGFFFDDNKKDSLKISLLSRVKVKKYEYFRQYYEYLRFHPDGPAEFRNLLSLITVNETSFFRNPNHFKILKEHILPEIIKKKHSVTNQPHCLSIWSAGCSSGEEAYSIALSIPDGLCLHSATHCEILGTDIDEKVLVQAQKAIYNKRSFRNTMAEYMNRYFERIGSNYFKLNTDIKNMVDFEYHNLTHLPYPMPYIGKWDIIFCRNVIIYFKIETVKKVIRNIYDSLTDGGYLFLGYSESLQGIFDEFSLIKIGNSFVYIKEKEGKKHTNNTQITQPVKKTQAAQNNDRHTMLYKEAFELFIKEEFDKALGKIKHFLREKPDDVNGHILAGRAYLEKEHLTQAVTEFMKVIEIDSLLAPAHYFLGVIYYRQNLYDQAIDEFQKTLYINADFVLAHFNLALMYQANGDKEQTLREYKNTIKLLNQKPFEEPLEFAGGFTVKAVLETCKRNIQQLGRENA